jgi:hypothetical protein
LLNNSISSYKGEVAAARATGCEQVVPFPLGSFQQLKLFSLFAELKKSAPRIAIQRPLGSIQMVNLERSKDSRRIKSVFRLLGLLGSTLAAFSGISADQSRLGDSMTLDCGIDGFTFRFRRQSQSGVERVQSEIVAMYARWRACGIPGAGGANSGLPPPCPRPCS